MQTAPVSPREPPTITTWPEVNLVEAGPRRGARPSTAVEITPAAGSPGAPSGIPIGATASSPVCDLPGATMWPTLAAWKLTVTSASTAAPSTSPLAALTPEAMSQATTGAPLRLIASIAASIGLRGAPSKPVPKIASISAPEPASASSRRSGSTSRAAGKRSRLAAASPDSSAPGASSSASTSKPVSASRRAATSPSPPLLPLPQTTRTGPCGESAAAARATAPPAASISSSEGTPWSSIAQRSTARMPSAS